MTQTSLPGNLHIKGTDQEGSGEEGKGALFLPLLPPKGAGKGEIPMDAESSSQEGGDIPAPPPSGWFSLGCCPEHKCDKLTASLASSPWAGMSISSEGRPGAQVSLPSLTDALSHSTNI